MSNINPNRKRSEVPQEDRWATEDLFATDEAWEGINTLDARKWGEGTRKCFEAQLRMFPNMLTAEVAEEIEKFRDQAYGWKLSGAGGGGYLILISDTEIPNAIKVNIRRS